jgi:uridine kinase
VVAGAAPRTPPLSHRAVRARPPWCSYYKGLPPGTDASRYNWDMPGALDMELLASHLHALHAGTDVRVPHYDFSRHARVAGAGTTISSSTTDVVILDGIFVLAVEAVRAACDLTLFTIEDLDVCLARRLRRDIAERGRDVASVLEQYVTFVKPGFANFIAPSMNFADILVPRARENLMAIEMIAQEVQRRVEVEAARAASGVAHTPRAVGIEFSRK